MITTHMMFGMLVPSHPPRYASLPSRRRIRRPAARPLQPSKSASVPGTRFWASISRLVKSMGSSVEEIRSPRKPSTCSRSEYFVQVVCDNDADDGVQVPDPPAWSVNHSPRTVALFSTGALANHPQARHDTCVHV
ncbi:hypothetical protein A0H81_10655 [Grifola frondosa]|uniref:Uncharacterized protein n=1 Tax=Grifola frondosa TaxID=5627 RepID=A0A1C7LXF5_GRIFR|nr:hypothetical protein A0H81_10655 [Grifola frondosa]